MLGPGPAGWDTAAESYVWPLEESQNVSSGFCAYRDAHYHSGIDLSTGGVEGLAVRAADAGYVLRVSTDYWGYGKAVYVKMLDGRVAVYGHLSNFNEAITAFVQKEQYALRRYKTNLFPSPSELPVQRGEVIGYTGQTGAGPQHLHFEVRTADNFPLNPLALGVGYDDRIAPEFRGILVRPLFVEKPNSRVAGSYEPSFYQAERGSRPGRYVIQKPILADGAVGLAVDCDDPTGYKEYTLVPRTYLMTANNLRFFEVRHDSLDFATTRQIDLEYDFDWLARTGAKVQRLHRHSRNQLPWYHRDLGDGVLDPERAGTAIVPGENNIVIIAIDAAGNEATLEMTVVFNKAPQLADVRLEAIRGQWHISGHAADSDNHITRFELRRITLAGEPGEVVWSTQDSVLNEDFSYITPGSFAGGEPLDLTVTDYWGATTNCRFCAPGGLQSDLDPERRDLAPVVGEFVPGGLILRAPDPESRPADDMVVMELQSISRSTGPWAFFVGADDYPTFSEINTTSSFMLAPDRTGLIGPADGPAEKTKGDVLRWPEDLIGFVGSEALVVYSKDGAARAEFNSGDVCHGTFIRIRPYNLPRDLSHRPSSMLYSFEPISVPFLQKVTVGISYTGLETSVDDLALYALRNDRKGWKYLSRDVDPAGRFMTAPVWSFGPYALVADTLPPQISDVVPDKGATTSLRRLEISCKITDDLSGIGSDQDIKILLDGEWLIAEYDPETLLCTTRPRNPLELGQHTLEIFARDRVGREDHFVRNFTVIDPKK